MDNKSVEHFIAPVSREVLNTHTHTQTHTGEEEAKHDPESYTRKESKVEDTVPHYQQLFRGWGIMWTPGWAVDRFCMNE